MPYGYNDVFVAGGLWLLHCWIFMGISAFERGCEGMRVLKVGIYMERLLAVLGGADAVDSAEVCCGCGQLLLLNQFIMLYLHTDMYDCMLSWERRDETQQ